MSKKVAIVQSNYIPWKGYFNIIRDVDEFVLLDDVQFTRRDWRNRNKIKTEHGLRWLTIPVNVKGDFFIRIKDVTTANDSWRSEHWDKISNAYRKSRFFHMYRERFEALYLGEQERNLSMINFKFLQLINSLLEIKTRLTWSMDFCAPDEKSERLLHICKQLKADEYISGGAAKSYLDVSLFKKNCIDVKWLDYSNYPVYKQMYEPFEHEVSIIDLIFNEGPEATRFLKQIS